MTTPLIRPRGLPKYQHVAAVIRDRISSGEYAPGARLPSEPQLDGEFSAYDRSTIRRGLAVLRAEGLITSEQGRGVFVRSVRLLRHPLLEVLRAEHRNTRAGIDAATGLFEDLTGAPVDGTDVRIRYSRDEAGPDLAEQFDLDPDTELLCREYTFVVDGEVHQVTRSYLPCTIADDTPLTDPANEQPGVGTFIQLARVGVLVDRVSVDISARMPSPDEASVLGCGEGTPLLVDRRRSIARERVVCVADTLTPADRIMYGIDVDMER